MPAPFAVALIGRGAVDAVFDLLKAHWAEPTVSAAGCRAVAGLLRTASAATDKVCDCDSPGCRCDGLVFCKVGCGVLLDVLKEHMEHGDAARAACDALAAASAHEAEAVALVEEGCASVLFACARRHAASAPVATAALEAIAAVAQPGAPVDWLAADGGEGAVEVLRRHPSDAAAVQAASRILSRCGAATAAATAALLGTLPRVHGHAAASAITAVLDALWRGFYQLTLRQGMRCSVQL